MDEAQNVRVFIFSVSVARVRGRRGRWLRQEAQEEAAAVGDGVDDGVFVEFGPGRREPEAAEPEEKDGDEEPEAVDVVVELGGVGVEVGDVEGEDDDGGVSAGGAEAAELLDVGDVVAAAFGGDSAAFAKVFELGEAFDEGQREEEEDAEAAEPGGDGDSGGSGSGEDADGVEAGEDDDIDQDGALEAERVGQRGDGVDAEPTQEAIWKGVAQRPEMGESRLDDVRNSDGEDDGGERGRRRRRRRRRWRRDRQRRRGGGACGGAGGRLRGRGDR